LWGRLRRSGSFIEIHSSVQLAPQRPPDHPMSTFGSALAFAMTSLVNGSANVKQEAADPIRLISQADTITLKPP
jgi:hypothetical protein